MNELIFRDLSSKLKDRIQNSNKILLLYGARQVGKTTLINHILENYPGRILKADGDQQDFVDVLSSRDLLKLKQLVSGYDLLFIDEAQRIKNIGINIKILHDQIPDLKIIATGSSSFELASKVAEPLTGRAWTYTLYPISVSELRHSHNPFELNRRLDEFLQFGMYPEALSIPNSADKEEFLTNLSYSYLYKDILDLGGIKHSDKIRDLLRLLAFQTGSLISYSELGQNLGMSTETVQRYIDLLEKSFVLFRLTGFSKNLRKEIVKSPKIYFNDLGIRNAVLENFNPPNKRPDLGGLWENFLLLERIKLLSNGQHRANRFFWRTYTGAEIDYIEESGGILKGYEFKWKNKHVKAPATWLKTYTEATFQYINRENYLDFVLSVEN
jgi:predicted AAA+ superfamily ATPase